MSASEASQTQGLLSTSLEAKAPSSLPKTRSCSTSKPKRAKHEHLSLLAYFLAHPIRAIASRLYTIGKEAAKQRHYSELRERYSLRDDFIFNGEGINIYGDGKLVVGSGCYIGAYSTIQLYTSCRVTLGDFVAISHHVAIYTMNRNSKDFIKGGECGRLWRCYNWRAHDHRTWSLYKRGGKDWLPCGSGGKLGGG